MCKIDVIPESVQKFILEGVNAEFKDCKAFLPTPIGDLTGRMSIVDGKVRFEVEGDESVRQYVAQCAPNIKLNFVTTMTLPDGTQAKLTRYSRFPGDNGDL